MSYDTCLAHSRLGTAASASGGRKRKRAASAAAVLRADVERSGAAEQWVQAAVQHGCRCVGLEIDRTCVDEAQQRAAEQGVAERCRFAVADLMRLPTGAMASGVLDAAAADGPAAAAPPATVALLFITGHMLSRMSAWLHKEWSRGGLSP